MNCVGRPGVWENMCGRIGCNYKYPCGILGLDPVTVLDTDIVTIIQASKEIGEFP